MSRNKPSVYVFGWPSDLGGADTKLVHLFRLLSQWIDFTVIPNHPSQLLQKKWTVFLEKLGIRYTAVDQLPERLSGFALALSNEWFFVDRIAHLAKEKGLCVVWSSEMMWHHHGELEAVRDGIIDKVLYVSDFQKAHLEIGYNGLPSHLTGNYIDPECFPFQHRKHSSFTIGRLSRPAPEKYPENFPVFYQNLDIPETRFRIMAWSSELASKYRWHLFDERWDLLKSEQESSVEFLHSLDLFVYPLGHRFKESWGRSTVEAMLTGCIPLVPEGHHFEHLIVTGETGFICSDFLDYKEQCQRLYKDESFRKTMALNCHEHAVNQLCDAKEHRKLWMEVFQ